MPDERELFVSGTTLMMVNNLLDGCDPHGAYIMGAACGLCAVAGLTPSLELLRQCRASGNIQTGLERIDQWIKASAKIKRRTAREALDSPAAGKTAGDPEN
jgi:hypothetical protein